MLIVVTWFKSVTAAIIENGKRRCNYFPWYGDILLSDCKKKKKKKKITIIKKSIMWQQPTLFLSQAPTPFDGVQTFDLYKIYKPNDSMWFGHVSLKISDALSK